MTLPPVEVSITDSTLQAVAKTEDETLIFKFDIGDVDDRKKAILRKTKGCAELMAWMRADDRLNDAMVAYQTVQGEAVVVPFRNFESVMATAMMMTLVGLGHKPQLITREEMEKEDGEYCVDHDGDSFYKFDTDLFMGEEE